MYRRIPMDEEYQATFEALQNLEQGKFQQLGDELLPWLFSQLAHLRPYGLTAEGKTRPGVPDSCVGPRPTEAVSAVEYTTQATQLNQKFEHDFEAVRQRCPGAKYILLCTNRTSNGFDFSGLRSKAVDAGVVLEIAD